MNFKKNIYKYLLALFVVIATSNIFAANPTITTVANIIQSAKNKDMVLLEGTIISEDDVQEYTFEDTSKKQIKIELAKWTTILPKGSSISQLEGAKVKITASVFKKKSVPIPVLKVSKLEILTPGSEF